MNTFFIMIVGIIILSSIVRGFYLEISKANSGLDMIHVWAILLVITTIIGITIDINQKEKVIDSKTLETPSMKIETIKNDSNIIKSDTTYIYKFKNNN